MITLELKPGHEFYKDSKCLSMWFDYVNESFDNYKDVDCESFLNAHKAFIVKDDNLDIGFGVYKNEENKNTRAMILLELYIKPKFRSIKRFLQLKHRIIKFLVGRHFNKWACAVDKDESRKIRAYKWLGFIPFLERDGLTYMHMELGV